MQIKKKFQNECRQYESRADVVEGIHAKNYWYFLFQF